MEKVFICRIFLFNIGYFQNCQPKRDFKVLIAVPLTTNHDLFSAPYMG